MILQRKYTKNKRWWNYWTSYHLCLKYNPFNQFFHRFSINFHNNEKHIALKPNLRKILISRSFNKHTKNPSTQSREFREESNPLSRGGANRPSTSVWNVGKGGKGGWRDEKGFETRWMKDGIEKSFATGFRATRIVATPLPTFPSPALNRTKEGGGWNRRICRPQIQKINLLNSLVKRIESSLEFSSFALKTFNVAPVFGRGIGNGRNSWIGTQSPFLVYNNAFIPDFSHGLVTATETNIIES